MLSRLIEKSLEALHGAWGKPTLRSAMLVVAGLLVLAIALYTVFVLVPNALVPAEDVRDTSERLKLRNDVRGVSVQVLAGMLVLLGLFLTARQIGVSRESQVSDRYSRAIDQLGHGELGVRIGAIHSLGRVARSSAADEIEVAKVLCAFVRSKRSLLPSSDMSTSSAPAEEDSPGGDYLLPLEEDVAAALDVIGSIGSGIDRHADAINLTHINLRVTQSTILRLPRALLHDADLRGSNLGSARLPEASFFSTNARGAKLYSAVLDKAYMYAADFSGVSFKTASLKGIWASKTNFDGANFKGANLENATFKDCSLQGATMRDAHIRGAVIERSDFTKCDLRDTDLRDAQLTNVVLTDARLEGADLRQAEGLTVEQISVAKVSDATRLPSELRGSLPPSGDAG